VHRGKKDKGTVPAARELRAEEKALRAVDEGNTKEKGIRAGEGRQGDGRNTSEGEGSGLSERERRLEERERRTTGGTRG
jgi:hypothetical protein